MKVLSINYRIKTVKNKINLDEIPFTIFGNKSDINDERIVSTEEGEKFTKKLSCSFFLNFCYICNKC